MPIPTRTQTPDVGIITHWLIVAAHWLMSLPTQLLVGIAILGMLIQHPLRWVVLIGGALFVVRYGYGVGL